jgi:hypothetical protein
VPPPLPSRRIPLLTKPQQFCFCFQHLSFWHFRRNKIQVWCWKKSTGFFKERISLPYFSFL